MGDSVVRFYLEENRTFAILAEKMAKLAEPGPIIDEVLQEEGGGAKITERIRMILPQSGRKWKGKPTAAALAPIGRVFRQDYEALTVHTHTIKPYHYLYFPDDGMTTRHHIGINGIPQEFMRRGAENAAPEIADMCINRIIQELEG